MYIPPDIAELTIAELQEQIDTLSAYLAAGVATVTNVLRLRDLRIALDYIQTAQHEWPELPADTRVPF